MRTKPLWNPSAQLIDTCKLTVFANSVGIDPPNYATLHKWSVTSSRDFWKRVWSFTHVQGNRGTSILDHEHEFIESTWFPEARLNFAENLLHANDASIAVVSLTETGARNELSFGELRSKVAQFAEVLKEYSVQPGDRVAGYLPNVAETVIAMLGAASIGAVWSSCSPDFGFQGAYDRFSQITPKVLVACDGYTYNGKEFNVGQNVLKLEQSIDSITHVIRLHMLSSAEDDFDAIFRRDRPSDRIEFSKFSFNHPLYVMYSSGTTGKPKCIVHGAGGTLLQHLKEHQLHVNLTPESKIFFFTTCGWMMWNWLVTALASGSTIVLYEGSAFWPSPDTLLGMIETEEINVFGAGAKYFSALEKTSVSPKTIGPFDTLESILSTGSPLAPESFDYLYREIKHDVQLASISGGTDLISCFALAVPWLPVYRGELQGPGLGMDVDVFDECGNSIRSQKGELVCKRTFPSKPIGFWNDSNAVKYRAAYFEKFSNIWAHGDFAEIKEDTGGLVIHGRSDAVLNPGGVRIGTAEIYRQVEAMAEITEALCVGQDWHDDVRVILFVVLAPEIQWSDSLRKNISQRIRTNATPRHVPAKILPVQEIPRTRSGKIAELAVRDLVHGSEVKNTSALANPDCLESFNNIPELQTD